jgi:hypothetical protein
MWRHCGKFGRLPVPRKTTGWLSPCHVVELPSGGGQEAEGGITFRWLTTTTAWVPAAAGGIAANEKTPARIAVMLNGQAALKR